MKDVILTTYFTTKPDPQRGKKWDPDSMALMSGWIDSLTSLNLNGVIFHDEPINGGSINQNVELIQYKQRTNWSCNDERFLCWLEYLKDHDEISRVFLTDLFDVSFYKNPFDVMGMKHDLYVGCGAGFPRKIGDNKWLSKRMLAAYKSVLHADKCTVNAGVIGGRRTVIITLLDYMMIDFERINGEENLNMAIFNNAVYDLFFEDRIIIGPPVTSLFKKYETTGNFAIRHK